MSTELAPSSVSTAAWGGELHQYAPGLTAFDGGPGLTQAVVWIGGLYAGLDVCGGSNLQALEAVTRTVGPGWSIVQAVRSSSYHGWGVGSITQDAEEVALLVEYLVKVAGKTKLVLVGHSTVSGLDTFDPRLPSQPSGNPWPVGLFAVGSNPLTCPELIPVLNSRSSVSQGTQDIIAFSHLLASSSLPGLSAQAIAAIAGYTLLAAASDRAFLEHTKTQAEIDAHLTPPHGMTANDFIPLAASEDPFGPARITYRRWRSLAGRPVSTAPGAGLALAESEDFFSPDLPDHFLRGAVFAAVDRPMQILLNELDETFAKDGDLGAWLARLEAALPDKARSGQSGIVKGADHSVTSEAAQKELQKMLKAFLGTL